MLGRLLKLFLPVIIGLITISFLVFFGHQKIEAVGSGSEAACDNAADADVNPGDNGSTTPFTFNYDAGSGNIVTGVCIKSGSNMFGDSHSGLLGNGTFESGCYTISGVGTQNLTVTRNFSSSSCQDISHLDIDTGPASSPSPSASPSPSPSPSVSPSPSPSASPSPSPSPSTSPSPSPSPSPTAQGGTPLSEPSGGGETGSLCPTNSTLNKVDQVWFSNIGPDHVTVHWSTVDNATGYQIAYGLQKDQWLWGTKVGKVNEVTLNNLPTSNIWVTIIPLGDRDCPGPQSDAKQPGAQPQVLGATGTATNSILFTSGLGLIMAGLWQAQKALKKAGAK